VPTRPTAALLAVVVALAAAAAEIIISVRMTPAWSPGALAFLLVFLAGPLVFLAIMAWRRRSHRVRSRVLLAVTLVAGGAGVALLGNDLYRFLHAPENRTPDSNPVLLPVYQWALVLLVWVVLVVLEGQEKRRAASVGAGSDGKGGTRR
jgi:hypothetical protein